MNWKMSVAKNISNIYGLLNILAKPQLDHRILMYHSIGEKVIRDSSNMYSISESAFRQQMMYLSNKFTNNIVGLSTDILENKNNSVAITFDDGYRGNLYIASPILEELKIPYTVFVSTEYIKDKNNNFLSESELKELANMPGASIGSHGVTHASLAQCSDKELKNELVDSKHYIAPIVEWMSEKKISIGYLLAETLNLMNGHEVDYYYYYSSAADSASLSSRGNFFFYNQEAPIVFVKNDLSEEICGNNRSFDFHLGSSDAV